MPIVTPEAPKRSLDALGAMLSTLAESAGLKRAAPHFAATIMASPNELRAPGLSYRVYVLGLVDIAEGEGLAGAKLSAWRHEFTSENEVVAAAGLPGTGKSIKNCTASRGRSRGTFVTGWPDLSVPVPTLLTDV